MSRKWVNFGVILQWAERWRAVKELQELPEFAPVAPAARRQLTEEIAKVVADHYPIEEGGPYKPAFTAVWGEKAATFRLRDGDVPDHEQFLRLQTWLNAAVWGEHGKEIVAFAADRPEYGSTIVCHMSEGPPLIIVCHRVS